MLLDNHYGPDPRVAFELELLNEAGLAARVIAWDRRSEEDARPSDDPRIIRVHVPAPSGGGRRSLVAALRFGRRVWRARKRWVGDASLLIVHDVYLLPLGWAVARRLGIPFIYDAHEEFALMEARRYPERLLRLVTSLESRLARDAQAVIVPGTSRVARWHGAVARPPIVLPNLVGRDRPESGQRRIRWDLLHLGTISEGRRPDILVNVARLRPDLRVAVAGRGRSVDYIAKAADELLNLEYLGWRTDVEELLPQARALYYGLDPGHPYSDVACPNTLYQALLHRKPLIFFCGGEPARLATSFKIGVRCQASAPAVSVALDAVFATASWEFDEAWAAVWEHADVEAFVETVASSSRKSP
jgi:hypothetical protein